MKKFRHVIIIDSKTGKPMTWDNNSSQLVFCTNENWQDKHTPCTFYTKLKAKKFIEKTIDNRTSWKMQPGEYLTIPFLLPIRFKYIKK